jgi:DNA repair protein RecN (Recombination protein N)
MLKSLQISNYALIDSLDVSFPEGLIIISGQTGAGKSILLGALSLLLGSKAEASSVGDNADSCVVEAVFGIPGSDSILKKIIEDNDLEGEDGDLILRRVVSKSGRSRSFVNDSPVNLQVLQSIGTRLVDIHSQNQTLLLSDHDFQLSLLDHFAGNENLLADCASSYSKMRKIESELSDIREKLSKLSEEREYTQARLDKLVNAKLQVGELEALDAEQKQLANAEEIKEGLGAVESIFDGEYSEGEQVSIVSALKEAQRHLEKVQKFLPDIASLAKRIEACRLELSDIEQEVSMANGGISVSEDRLNAVEERMALLYDLMKQYGASDVPELIERRDALSQKLFDSTAMEERMKVLEKESEAEKKNYEGICSRLHTSREKAAKPFAAKVEAMVHSLELEHAVFEVRIASAPSSKSGTDAVSFLFSSTGSEPLDLSRCASGGEMSRLMLCLKAMMAKFVNMPTLIFDEIDSGVSGSVADKMGRMICDMGSDMQIFAITHLPQVAAKGKAHYLVEKEYNALGTKAYSSIRQISGKDRVMEIARMLSGEKITTAAIANAKSLLGVK